MPYGIAHIRPYNELAADLTNQTVARYNFITPDLCDDGHDTCAPQNNSIQQIDTWLGTAIPMISIPPRIPTTARFSSRGTKAQTRVMDRLA